MMTIDFSIALVVRFQLLPGGLQHLIVVSNLSMILFDFHVWLAGALINHHCSNVFTCLIGTTIITTAVVAGSSITGSIFRLLCF